jgi:Fic family protein
MENYNPKSNWNYIRKTKTDEELKMTRKEIALRNARMRAEQTKEKVYKAIEKLKKNGEKITILKIAEIANVNKNSANKYLKQAREEGIV